MNTLESDRSDLERAITLLSACHKLEHDNATQQLERSKSYITLVLSLGYVGLFAIWNFSADLIPSRANALTGILAGVSLAIFMAFEIKKMFAMQKVTMRHLQSSAVQPRITDLEGLLRYADAHQRNQQELREGIQEQMRELRALWKLTFLTTILFGFGAGLLLLYNLFAHLTKAIPYLPT